MCADRLAMSFLYDAVKPDRLLVIIKLLFRHISEKYEPEENGGEIVNLQCDIRQAAI